MSVETIKIENCNNIKSCDFTIGNQMLNIKYAINGTGKSTIYEKNEFWKCNHKYVKEYRDKMTRHNSPNVMSCSKYDMNFPLPMRYVLKRVIEDYVKVSEFIQLMISDIVDYFNELEKD